MLHALFVGLAVVDLATGRPDGKPRAASVLETALHLFAGANMAQPKAGMPIPYYHEGWHETVYGLRLAIG